MLTDAGRGLLGALAQRLPEVMAAVAPPPVPALPAAEQAPVGYGMPISSAMSFGVSFSIALLVAAMDGTFAAIALVMAYTVSAGSEQAATMCVA